MLNQGENLDSLHICLLPAFLALRKRGATRFPSFRALGSLPDLCSSLSYHACGALIWGEKRKSLLSCFICVCVPGRELQFAFFIVSHAFFLRSLDHGVFQTKSFMTPTSQNGFRKLNCWAVLGYGPLSTGQPLTAPPSKTRRTLTCPRHPT